MPLRMFLSRLRGLLASHRNEARIQEEIDSHLDLLASDFQRRGMTQERAHIEARRQFGGATQVAENWRDQRSLPLLETFAVDLRYALRQLRSNPGFAASAVLTLALGIGANTAIFRVLDAVVLRSLPVRDPEQLVILQGSNNGKANAFNYPLFREIAARQHAVQGMFAFSDLPVRDAVLPGSGPLTGVAGRIVTGSYFQVLGVNARLGRVFTEDDDRPAAPPVAVISHSFWLRAFGGKTAALGRSIQINQAVVTIVGVAPQEFFGERVGSAPDVWLPMHMAPQVWINLLNSPAFGVLTSMARLRPDVPLPQAQAALNGLYGQLTDLQVQHTGRNEYRLELAPGSQGVRDLQKQFSRPLVVLAGIVGLVLLIACSNLANLLLARAAARTHEMGVRLALGAARGRLVRQLLTESLVLAVLGSLLGFALAAWGSRELVTLASAGQNWRLSIDAGWRVIGFTAGVSVVAACLFGLAPALAATRLDVHSALQANGRTQTGGRTQHGSARAFVVAQVSLSLLLVAGASLLVRSFWNLNHQDFGYRQEGLLLVQMRLDFAALALRTFKETPVQQVYERLNAIPGVRSAAMAGLGPFAQIQSGAKMALPERPPMEGDDVRSVAVSPRYFETMGIPMVAGRPITEDDRAGTARVAVVSQTAARRLFGFANPIGRFFSGGERFNAEGAIQIVGVAHDIRFSNPWDPFGMILYQPLSQAPLPLSSVVLRTIGDPALFAASARQALQDTAPRLKIANIRPLGELLESQLGQERMMALLSAAFGLLALVLASVGLYGAIAYGVERRTQEIGIRLALGASRGQVSGMLLREVALVLTIGLTLGGAATVALGQSVKALLFGVTPHDPVMLAFAAALLSVVALVAGYLPARRAARLDPMNALRQE